MDTTDRSLIQNFVGKYLGNNEDINGDDVFWIKLA
jgi:hypothetical protein